MIDDTAADSRTPSDEAPLAPLLRHEEPPKLSHRRVTALLSHRRGSVLLSQDEIDWLVGMVDEMADPEWTLVPLKAGGLA